MAFHIIYGDKIQEKTHNILGIFRTNDLSPHFVNWKFKLKAISGIMRVGKQTNWEKCPQRGTKWWCKEGRITGRKAGKGLEIHWLPHYKKMWKQKNPEE